MEKPAIQVLVLYNPKYIYTTNFVFENVPRKLMEKDKVTKAKSVLLA